MFNAIVAASLRHRLLVVAAASLLLAWGWLVALRTPVDVFPDLDKPVVTVLTEAGGMAPQEVEQRITMILEGALSGMPGVDRVRATSGVGLSIVHAEFAWGTDVYRNRQMVAERLALARAQLPTGLEPMLGPVSSIMGEIMLIALPIAPMTDASHTQAAMQARDYTDHVLRPRLLAVPGVSQIIPIGGEVRTLRVAPNTARMAQWGVSLTQIEQALQGYASNAGGGFIDLHGREYMIRHIGQSSTQDTLVQDLAGIAVGWIPDGYASRPIVLHQVADVAFAAGNKRGDGGYNGLPAVIITVQKQPGTDTVRITRAVEAALEELAPGLPKGLAAPQILFRQADFISASIDNVRHALRDGALMVAVVLFAFLLSLRTTLISLLAIPLSLAVAVLAFRAFGLSINVMTLGGLAIAIGELVDDAVVDVENIVRRLKHNRSAAAPLSVFEVVRRASVEVRSGIVYATLVVVLVFVPLFALPGIEGRMFAPLGVAYIVSILASMLVSMTVTPALAYWLLPHMQRLGHGDSPLVAWLKRWDARVLAWSFPRARSLLAAAALLVLLAAASVPWLPRAFLPAFNEGAITLGLMLKPGTSLEQANTIGREAEKLLLEIPEVRQVGRRTGRAELDEHAEGVHVAEMDVDLIPSERTRAQVEAHIRERLALLPAHAAIGQPISHRLDHILSGVRAAVAVKIFGDDTDTLYTLAESLREQLTSVPGLVDVSVEPHVRVPHIAVRIDPQKLAQTGLPPGEAVRLLQTLTDGSHSAQITDGSRRYDLVLRLPDAHRTPQNLAATLIDTPAGRLPVAAFASVTEVDGPNQIGRENGRRRIAIYGNTDGSNMAAIIAQVRSVLGAATLPAGYFVTLEGQFQAQEEATRLIAALSLLSLALIFIVLYARYQSVALVAIIMANIPLALIGSVAAMWLAHITLSVASMVGFVTLAGIASRNGILKISHYLNLCRFEGETFSQSMIVRGSLERLTPVLMTAMVAAFALIPLLFAAHVPGKEILHPVAVVIFGGLVSATLLDTLLTPVLYWLFGREATRKCLQAHTDSAHQYS